MGVRAPLSENAGMREFVRYATLAANSHNTQPWRFRLGNDEATILPELSRHTPVVDPDGHHLFASLGCGAENFAIAARARGRGREIRSDDADGGCVVIGLANGPAEETTLFKAIPERQSTRSEYDGRPVPSGHLALLEEAARLDGVSLLLLTDASRIETLLECVLAGNTAQMNDRDFVRELRSWLRFSPAQALATRDGLFGASSGNPTLPGWLAEFVFPFVFTTAGENDRYARHIRSSSGIAIFTSDRDDKAHQVQVGRSFQRFALEATALGIRQAFINQPVEVPTVRAEFANWLGLGDQRPDLVVRFGYADPLPMSLRRPVELVVA